MANPISRVPPAVEGDLVSPQMPRFDIEFARFRINGFNQVKCTRLLNLIPPLLGGQLLMDSELALPLVNL